ncbi:MAG: dTDP-glucose 4,6-dehydratase [Ferruginibacter sp.]|nr:dTDP-glucose 4,6-dehydratase [Cytophagales bacterium]
MTTQTILITGGAGFIGSHVVRLFVNQYADYRIVNLDQLTYAGNLANLRDVETYPNYTFVRGDITDAAFVRQLFGQYHFDGVIHLAAESHVDRSITHPLEFVMTNVIGTVNLLNAAKEAWQGDRRPSDGERPEAPAHLFYHVSTDEVYGSLHRPESFFTESTAYDPQSPYSASKASSDHFVRAYHNTYGLPVVITNCSNNYGPNQFPEKLLPLFIHNIQHHKPLPVYGKGENVRDWLYVVDHARAIDKVYHQGRVGETYNIGGFNEWRNLDLIQLLCRVMDRKLGRPEGESARLITYVTDRAGHDLRYAIDAAKIMNELGWKPSLQFEEGLEKTVDWYLTHSDWLADVTSGEYQRYYDTQYTDRFTK